MLVRIIGFLILFFVTRKILEYTGFTEDKKEEIKKIKESKKDNEESDNEQNKEKFINRELKLDLDISVSLPAQDYHIGYSLSNGSYYSGAIKRLDIWKGTGFDS